MLPEFSAYLINKVSYVDLIIDEIADLACITETWLGPEVRVALSDVSSWVSGMALTEIPGLGMWLLSSECVLRFSGELLLRLMDMKPFQSRFRTGY